MKMLIKPVHILGCCTVVACVLLLRGLLASAHPPPSVPLGKASMLVSASYRVMLETPQVIFQGQDATVVVHVQNRQGLPVDGIAVAFKIAPPRTRYASIRPAHAYTEDGRAHAILRSDLVGRVRITVRVGILMKQATITVVMPVAGSAGHGNAGRL